MAEDWQDCPALGPGWKRRESFRKSGASCGRSDIYYQSPTGDKIRSKVELTRYLGPACDLTLFDFRQGILCYPAPKTHPLPDPSKKQKKPSKPANVKKHQGGLQKSDVRKATPRAENSAGTDTAPASLLVPGRCENCGIRVPRNGIRKQRLKTLCEDCRAQRIAFNREQRMFKRVGCGECTACLVKEDCGACSICRLQLPRDVASGLYCKCEQRRCLRIVEKSRGCGVCRGCQNQEDCGCCRFCLRPPRPGRKRQWRCLQRRCLWHFAHRFRGHPQGCHQCPPQVVVPPIGKRDRDRRKSSSKVAAQRHSQAQPVPPLPALQHPEPTELHISDLVPTSPAEFIYYCVDEDELQPYTNHRQNRKCGACAACLRRMDCGHCDFCCDKPKFGGSNQKRQKCRWRQCLQFAMVKQEKVDAPEEWTAGTAFPTSPTLQSGCPGKAVDPDLPPVKQESPGPEEDREENREDYVSASAPEEEEAGGIGTPVITEIFSLGGTRLRDIAAWWPRSKDLKKPEAKMQ
ncbi:methyl-CpG-binding domain protein 1 isoform X11 [Microtus oregoni]|uniref:methyl-CpG-binding domain protein 1 isoform X11 n=1 Tax=Microtus oregoni TaxID=111838 RepID=UPI001BB1521C|nr:methyl-CpG-binding domain protein 1 isoform X11 [Microtus oregoni]